MCVVLTVATVTLLRHFETYWIILVFMTTFTNLLTHSLTHSVVQEPEGYHRTHNSSPPVPMLSQSNPIHTPQSMSLRSILIPSSHLRLVLPSGLYPSGFPTKTFYTFLTYLMHATCPAHLIHLYLVCVMISEDEYKL
jgi:hypothetical protein